MSQHCDLILVLLHVLDVKMSKDGINLKETSLAKVKCLCHIVIGCKILHNRSHSTLGLK